MLSSGLLAVGFGAFGFLGGWVSVSLVSQSSGDVLVLYLLAIVI